MVSVGEQLLGVPGCADDNDCPNHDDAVDAIEPNAVVRKEECTQSMKCM